MQSALRHVRAMLVRHELRVGPARDPEKSVEDFRLPVASYGRPALALGGVLLIASIVWYGRVHRSETPRSAQAVPVLAAQPEAVHPSQAEASDPIGSPPASNVAMNVPRTARTHRGKRVHSLPK